MSQLNVDNIQNRTGSSGGPNFPSGISVAVGQTAYIHGNLQVDGTETIINTETLNVADKTVGIGSTSNASNTTADGSGIEVFASSSQTGNNKTLTWGNTLNSWEFGPNNVGLKVGTGVTINSSGVTVTGVVTATSFSGDGSSLTGMASTDKVATTTLNVSGISTFASQVSGITAMGANAVDCSTANYFTKTITGATTFTFTNVPTGVAYGMTMEVTLNGSNAITWPATVKWPADTAPTVTDGKTQLFMFVTDDGGTRWRGSSLVDYTN